MDIKNYIGIIYACFILWACYSCKSYKELVKKNTCGQKPIELTKERPFKVKNKTNAFVLSFLSGFNKSNVKVIINDSIYMNEELTSGHSIVNAGDLVLNGYTEYPINVHIDDDCFDFYLDKNFVHYEIHKSVKKFYINIQHFPSIGE